MANEKERAITELSEQKLWPFEPGANDKKAIKRMIIPMMTQNAMSKLRSFPSVATKKHHYRYGYDSIFFSLSAKKIEVWA